MLGMTHFTIVPPDRTGPLLTFRDREVRTSLEGSAARVDVSTTRGVHNPLAFLAPELVPSVLVGHTRSTRIDQPSVALSDAVRGLHELGTRHGVTGVVLNEQPGTSGLFRYAGEGEAYSNRRLDGSSLPTTVRSELDAAARGVLAALRS